MGFEVLLRRVSPSIVLLWCEVMQRAVCTGKGINQEMSAQEYRIGDVLKDTKAHKGCWTLRANTLYKSTFICLKKLLGLNWYSRDWMLEPGTSQVDYYCLSLLASLMVTNSFGIPR